MENYKSTQNEFNISILNSISSVDKETWNNLILDEKPLMDYEFFLAMEKSNCTSKLNGWEPFHFLVKKNNIIVGIIPNFKKLNSNGEYVFDHSWADAYHRFGINYYPKFLSAIPFTPINGIRFFFSSKLTINEKNKIIISLIKKIEENQVETFHINFINHDQSNYLKDFNFMQRIGIQYHWSNNNYNSFSDFLSMLKSKKKKNIIKERNFIQNLDIKISLLKGSEIKKEDWDFFYHCYKNTINKKWSFKYLNYNFFLELSKSNLIENILLIVAKDKNKKYLACTLNFVGENKLYGRYWGCAQEIPFLHFELCYYQAIEYAINNNIEIIEAGAQGEHKISRGYIPTLTYSNHWIRNKDMKAAISDFLMKETLIIKRNMDYLMKSNPYKIN